MHKFSRINQVAPVCPTTLFRDLCKKSSSIAEMGDRDHNSWAEKKRRAAVPHSRWSWVPV